VKVYVVGAGAVGTYLGDLLAETGAEIVYAPREFAAVQPTGTDLAIVAVKSYATHEAIATLRVALAGSPDATILTAQNGVGNEELLAAAFGADRVMAGALTVPVACDDDGVVHAAAGGGLGLAPVGDVSHNWLVAAFERTPLPVLVSSDYRAMKWSKLALNIVANATCAILDETPERALATPDVFGFELAALRELRAVLGALDIEAIDLPRYPVRAFLAAVRLPEPVARLALAKRMARARGTKLPSLALDVRSGRRVTEVRALNGAIGDAARRWSTGRGRSLATPVNDVLTRLVELVAREPAERTAYRNRPAAIAAAIAATQR